jgi:hypothetical protein
MAAFLGWLHGRGQHYIPIADPGLKREPGYFAYDELMASGCVLLPRSVGLAVGAVC